MNIKKIVLVFTPLFSCYANELQKVFHHRMATHDGANAYDIELGKVILYFRQPPVIKKTENSTPKSVAVSFFVPDVAITDQAQKMIKDLAGNPNKFYQVTIKSVTQPRKGMEIMIAYDPAHVLLSYGTFDAITCAKGLEFRLYNKTLLDALKRKQENILRTACSKNPGTTTVIIDCGHGGSDAGTIGYFETVEKDLALTIGLKLAHELHTKNIPVLLTRNKDVSVALDQRTYIANGCPQQALLISLHANHADAPGVQGLETFHVSPHLFIKEKNQLETAIDVIIQAHDDIQFQKSNKLARTVHTNILSTVKGQGQSVVDRNVRQSVTQVLRGTKWPAILIEVDYVSNKTRALLLKDPAYQQLLVNGIVNGIAAYLLC